MGVHLHCSMEQKGSDGLLKHGGWEEKTLGSRVDMCSIVRFIDRRGRWQTLQWMVLFITYFATDVHTISIAFIGFQPKFACVDGDYGDNFTSLSNYTEVFEDKCEVHNSTTNSSSVCTGGFRYDVNRHETIVSEWDLICDKAYLSEISQLLYTVGMAVGSAFVSPLSDRLGRKWPFLVLRFIYVFLAFGLALSPNIIVFMIIRFLTGAAGMALSLIRFVYLVELCSVRLRPFVTIMTGILWAGALCFESGIAQLMRGLNWRYFQVAISIPTLTIILDFIFLKESLLWLFANGKEKEATKLLKIAMKTNGMTEETLLSSEHDTQNREDRTAEDKGDIPDTGDAAAADSKGVPNTKTKQGPRKLNILDVLRNKTTRKIVPIICFAWFVNSLVYYGIFLMSYAMAGDRILNFFLSAVVEIPSYLALYVCLKYFGRKKPLVGLHALCAVSLLLAGIFNFTLSGNTKVTVMQVVTFIGKFGISATFTLLFIYTAEVFPTNFRTSGLGMGSVAARFGSFLSPFSSILVRALPWGPGIIFGGLCLVLTCILLMAPETRYRTLPQSIEEIETWKEDKNKNVKENREMMSKPA